VDNRKFFTFLLLGLSIFLLMNSWSAQKQRDQDEAKKQTQAKVDAKKERDAKLEERIKAAKADPNFSFGVEIPREHFVLGSMTASDGYSMLVVLDNQGAGIERIELVERDSKGKLKYRSLQTKEKRGYAGYLGLEAKSLTIQTVPKGSPADAAVCLEDAAENGLRAGDEINGWSDLSGEPSRRKWDDWTDTWRIGQSISIKVKRGEKQLSFNVQLEEMPLDVVRSEDDFRLEQVKGNDPVLSCLTTLASVNEKSIEEGDTSLVGLESIFTGTWQGQYIEVDGGMGVQFTKPLAPLLKLAEIDADLELVKEYRLRKPNTGGNEADMETWRYHIELKTTIRNKGTKDVKLAVRQDGVNGLTLEGWWYPTKISPFFFSVAGARDVVLHDGTNHQSLFTTRTIVDHAVRQSTHPETDLFGASHSQAARSLSYIGLDGQAFTAALLPGKDDAKSLKSLSRGKARVLNSACGDVNSFPSAKYQAANIGFWVETEQETVAPNSETSWNYTLFAGPKDPDLLAAYKLDRVLYYGWDIFGFFAKRLGWVLHAFYSLSGNFGIAIFMLTVLVRSLMFPVSRKMAMNAQKMQSVQPHTQKLREAFKEDPRKMMQAQQMLFKKAGINQFAGCLPALIQLPIIIGLYRCVSVDVKLRQQPLVPGWDWCSNLAGPDMLYEWHSWAWDIIAGRGTGYFGPYFNILPIITVTLFIIQQKVLMPKATDEQTAMAQKIMMFMTVMMGVFFFRVPSGLCIYFITSSTWSLVERMLIRKFTPKSAKIELPESTAADIIQVVSKSETGAPLKRTAPTTNEKPREKMTKPPETLAEMFPKWFGKKEEPKPSTETKESNGKGGKGGNRRPPPRPPNNRSRPKKPK
jgi:YidC/Oxa1 family membrane protein insertase